MSEKTIFKKLLAVQSDLSQMGIGKSEWNDFSKYNFRGIDQVYQVLSPILVNHGVIIMPNVQSVELSDVKTSGGKSSCRAVASVEYHFFDESGNSVAMRSYGEGIDTSDKATNKAITAAYKYMIFQAYAINRVIFTFYRFVR